MDENDVIEEGGSDCDDVEEESENQCSSDEERELSGFRFSSQGEGSNNSLKPPKRKKRKSAPIWEEVATKIFVNGEMVGSKCNFCSKTYKNNRGNTSNIVQHVLSKHKVDQKHVKRLKRD